MTQPPRMQMIRRAAPVIAVLALAGCAGGGHTERTVTSAPVGAVAGIPHGHPQAIDPTVGAQPTTQAPPPQTTQADPTPGTIPVGNPNDHAPPLSQVQSELRQEVVAVKANNSTCINPLRYVSVWERTDQGVDATMPVGAPILAPCKVKVLATIPDWYAGQPLIYFELLDGPWAGKVQYVAEEITDLAPPGSILDVGQVIARYAPSGTGIEYGWSTLNGVTLAMATTGYEEGVPTPAGQSIRAWLNSLGANAGSG